MDKLTNRHGQKDRQIDKQTNQQMDRCENVRTERHEIKGHTYKWVDR